MSAWRNFAVAALLISSAALAQTSSTAPAAPQASGASSVTGLVAKVRRAFSNITHARSSLSSGGSSTHASGLLARAENELKEVRALLPSGALLAKLEQAKSSLAGGSGTSGASSGSGNASSILSEAQGIAAKLDPQVASSLGAAQAHAQNGNAPEASSRIDEAKQRLEASPLETVFEKVVAARTKLKAGDRSGASQSLGNLPSLASVEQKIQSELTGSLGVGGSGSPVQLPNVPGTSR